MWRLSGGDPGPSAPVNIIYSAVSLSEQMPFKEGTHRGNRGGIGFQVGEMRKLSVSETG